MRRLVLFEPTRLMRDGLARLLAESGYDIVYQDNQLDPERAGPPDATVELVLTELPDPDHAMSGWFRRISASYPRAMIVILTNCSDDPQRLAEAFEQGAAGYLAKNSSFDAMEGALDAVMSGQVVYPLRLREELAKAAAGRPAAAPAVHSGQPAASPQQTAHGPERSTQGSQASWRSRDRLAASPAASTAGEPPADQHHSGANGTAHRRTALPPHGAAGLPPHRPAQHADRGDGDVADAWLRNKGLSDREAEILRYVATGDANKVIANRLDISEATVKSHIKSLLRKLDFQNRTQAAVWAHSHAAELLSGSRRAAE